MPGIRKLSQKEFADHHRMKRQYLWVLVKNDRVFPAPKPGRKKGKVVLLFRADAVILPPVSPRGRRRKADLSILAQSLGVGARVHGRHDAPARGDVEHSDMTGFGGHPQLVP